MSDTASLIDTPQRLVDSILASLKENAVSTTEITVELLYQLNGTVESCKHCRKGFEDFNTFVLKPIERYTAGQADDVERNHLFSLLLGKQASYICRDASEPHRRRETMLGRTNT